MHVCIHIFADPKDIFSVSPLEYWENHDTDISKIIWLDGSPKMREFTWVPKEDFSEYAYGKIFHYKKWYQTQ